MEIKSNLTTQELLIVNSEFEKRKKSMAIAYILCVFLGLVGAHRFYTGNVGSAIAMLVCFVGACFIELIAGLILPIIGFFFGVIFFSPLFIWFIIDLVWLHGRVNEINIGIEKEILQHVYNQRAQMM
ncbi:TM2 domain-containing protein [Hazenella coriacea]|nr:TM2 domain-containing protein [Hazenella coriacea]